jgi:hypothetical protein
MILKKYNCNECGKEEFLVNEPGVKYLDKDTDFEKLKESAPLDLTIDMPCMDCINKQLPI